MGNNMFVSGKYRMARGLVVGLGLLLALEASVAQASQLEFAAVVKSHQTAVLSSQMDGLITAVAVNVGDTFSKGDILLSIDCTLQQAALSKARAEVEYARNEYKSTKSLEKLNSSTKVQVARSAAQFAKAKAELDAADYRVSNCVVYAPFDGTVIQSWARTHESVNAKSELLEIVNNSNLIAEFLAPSNAIGSLKAGRTFQLMVGETGQGYAATIDKVVPYVDSVSQTVKVISRLESNNTDLWAGMSGLVVLEE